MSDLFFICSQLDVVGKIYDYFSLFKFGQQFDIFYLFYLMKILLENLFWYEDGGVIVGCDYIEVVVCWNLKVELDIEIVFMFVCVVLQDFIGVFCVVDLVVMCDVVVKFGGCLEQINLQIFFELVIDYLVQVDVFGILDVLDFNGKIEFQCNQECYGFLCWGQKVFYNFKVVLFNIGIVYQVNLENLVCVVMIVDKDGMVIVYLDIVFGIDSYIIMINGIGVLGWGVGGIEVEVVMFGQLFLMLILQVVGFKLIGKLFEGVIVIDLVLIVIQMLCKYGVVGKFVEFFGEGLQYLLLVDCVMIGNMVFEYGVICGIFLIDYELLNYLCLFGCSEEQIVLVEVYVKVQGLWYDVQIVYVSYSVMLEFDMGMVKLLLVGFKCLQDCVLLEDVKQNYCDNFGGLIISCDKCNEDVFMFVNEGGGVVVGNEQLVKGYVDVEMDGSCFCLKDGVVVIVVIIFCINIFNLVVMIGVGLLVCNVVVKGLDCKFWVKILFGLGLCVVIDYLEKVGVLIELEKIGFYVVGYGCIICIGNFGLLLIEVSVGIVVGDLVVILVLLGNCNFEGCVYFEVKMNYLVSLLLVVVYVIVGIIDIDLIIELLGIGSDGQLVFLCDIWLSNKEIGDVIVVIIGLEMFKQNYVDVFKGDICWNIIKLFDGDLYDWDGSLIYIKNLLYFEGMIMQVGYIEDVYGVWVMGLFGDLIIIDYIFLVGNIKKDLLVGCFLQECGVQLVDFNSYGSCCGNDDVMVCGIFVNIWIKNLMFGGEEGGNILYFLVDGGELQKLVIYDVVMKYKVEGVLLVVFVGKEYGIGFLCDWVVKGINLFGVKVVIVESFECIYCFNLVGMGVLLLQFKVGENVQSLGLDGLEMIDIIDLQDGVSKIVIVIVIWVDGIFMCFQVYVMLLMFKEVEYFKYGGLLQYVLCQLVV